nr:uncharacterized protein LOC109776943 [Aegilops tauschii subsp. strangulata]
MAARTAQCRSHAYESSPSPTYSCLRRPQAAAKEELDAGRAEDEAAQWRQRRATSTGSILQRKEELDVGRATSRSGTVATTMDDAPARLDYHDLSSDAVVSSWLEETTHMNMPRRPIILLYAMWWRTCTAS